MAIGEFSTVLTASPMTYQPAGSTIFMLLSVGAYRTRAMMTDGVLESKFLFDIQYGVNGGTGNSGASNNQNMKIIADNTNYIRVGDSQNEEGYLGLVQLA